MPTKRKETKQRPRKLLVATVGLAAVSYVVLAEACGGKTDGESSSSSGTTNYPTSGNLPAPQPQPTNTNPPTSGNLPSPPPPIDAGLDAARDGAVRDASND